MNEGGKMFQHIIVSGSISSERHGPHLGYGEEIVNLAGREGRWQRNAFPIHRGWNLWGVSQVWHSERISKALEEVCPHTLPRELPCSPQTDSSSSLAAVNLINETPNSPLLQLRQQACAHLTRAFCLKSE